MSSLAPLLGFFFLFYFWVFSPFLNTVENSAGAKRSAGGEGASAATKAGAGAGGGRCRQGGYKGL